jgi:hypothetical protein
MASHIAATCSMVLRASQSFMPQVFAWATRPLHRISFGPLVSSPIGQTLEVLVALGGQNLMVKGLGVDHQQRRVDPGAGVLERVSGRSRQDPPLRAVSGMRRLRCNGPLAQTVTRRPPGQSIVEARSMLQVGTPSFPRCRRLASSTRTTS